MLSAKKHSRKWDIDPSSVEAYKSAPKDKGGRPPKVSSQYDEDLKAWIIDSGLLVYIRKIFPFKQFWRIRRFPYYSDLKAAFET
jgi:hypothetical protein